MVLLDEPLSRSPPRGLGGRTPTRPWKEMRVKEGSFQKEGREAGEDGQGGLNSLFRDRVMESSRVDKRREKGTRF